MKVYVCIGNRGKPKPVHDVDVAEVERVGWMWLNGVLRQICAIHHTTSGVQIEVFEFPYTPLFVEQ